jgi:hypothetical protein
LNGGNNYDLHELRDQISTFAKDLGLPWADFHEDAESLAGAMTSIGVVVPTHIYEYARLMREPGFGTPEMFVPYDEFARFLNQFGLAK